MKHHIYIAIHIRYANPIFPNLPILLTSYLLQNPEKKPLYLNPNISLSNLLKHLNFKEPLLIQIIALVEESNDNTQ